MSEKMPLALKMVRGAGFGVMLGAALNYYQWVTTPKERFVETGRAPIAEVLGTTQAVRALQPVRVTGYTVREYPLW